ncbi:DUF2726 domain-containing protein [Sphingobium abikonense]|uniref:DUF2726 domain-containing protein n=1 Tax=Sphingobium abikonense TaxID=86193 RepID=UPI003510EA2B
MLGLELGDLQVGELLLILALGVLIAVQASRLLPRGRRSRFRRRYWRPNAGQEQAPDLSDIGGQLRAVMAATFQKRRVLSSSEYRVFKIIEDDLAAMRRGYRVFGQTSLGEILQSPCADAFRSINSKRADILVIDRSGWPILAVEYQGGGHYQGTAVARDAIKKEALRKAGVRYVEVSESDSDDQIRSRVREQLG